jgi:hypothetical protein
MKTIVTFLVAVFLLVSFSHADPSVAELQNASIGTIMTVECENKKTKGGKFPAVYYNLDVNIKVQNNQANPVLYNLDVFFLVHSFKNDGVKWRDKKSEQISLPAGVSTNLKFHALDQIGKDKVIINWLGYIVRLSAYGKPIKMVASSRALEKLAEDPIKMALLESGQIVPAK